MMSSSDTVEVAESPDFIDKSIVDKVFQVKEYQALISDICSTITMRPGEQVSSYILFFSQNRCEVTMLMFQQTLFISI